MAILQSHTCKMGTMIAMVLIYFIVELVIGHILHSITLVADSFHMLSDLIALIIGIAARRISKWPKSSKNTFGWQRAEVVGTLLNTVMLTTLTFTILIESIQRFISPETVDKPKLLLGVGAGGLLINILGLIILGCDHGHSHGGDDTIEIMLSNETEEDKLEIKVDGDAQVPVKYGGHGHSHSKKHKHGAGRMNLKAVFLHVLADFFGSVAVVISALVLWLVPGNGAWKLYIDPLISLFMVFLILGSTIPLLKKSALILLQSVPKDVSIADLKSRMELIEGIEKVHDLHVWLLQSDVIIGTVHIRCANENYVKVSKEAKKLFHDFNIHCTTIQAEFDEHAEDSNSNRSVDGGDDQCVLYCDDKSTVTGTNECKAKQSCCPTRNSSSVALIANSNNNNGNSSNNPNSRSTETDASIPLVIVQPTVPDYQLAASGHKDSNTTQLSDFTERL